MAGRITRCPFLNRTSINQIKKCSDDLLENIAKRCPVASASVGQKVDAYVCPYQNVVDRKIEKEIKMIANKCHDWTQKTSQKPLAIEAEKALEKKRNDQTYRIWSQVERNVNGPESKVNGENLVTSDFDKIKIFLIRNSRFLANFFILEFE